jgi:hypothetical protein
MQVHARRRATFEPMPVARPGMRLRKARSRAKTTSREGATPTKAKVSCWLRSIFSTVGASSMMVDAEHWGEHALPSMARATSTLTFCTWMSRVRRREPDMAERTGVCGPHDFPSKCGRAGAAHLDVGLPDSQDGGDVALAHPAGHLGDLGLVVRQLIPPKVGDHAFQALRTPLGLKTQEGERHAHRDRCGATPYP